MESESTKPGIRDAIRSIRRKFGLKDRITEGIKEDILSLESDLNLKELSDRTQVEAKDWKYPFKWRKTIKASAKKVNKDKILFFYLNSKTGQSEAPMLLPFHGNMVIYKNKPYVINPKATWTIIQGIKQYRAYYYKDYDRRPVSSEDYNETIAQGFGTEDDELLIKAALEARVNTAKAQISKVAMIVGILLVVGVIIYFIAR